MIKRFSETAGTRTLTDDELRGLWTGLDAQPGAAADAIRVRLLTRPERQRNCRHAVGRGRSRGGRVAAAPDPHEEQAAACRAAPPTALALLTRRRGRDPRGGFLCLPGLTLTCEAHKALAVLHGGRYEWKDLRRTVATRLAGLGFEETTIGRTLNHARHTVTGRHYNQHAYLAGIRKALTAWDRTLGQILDPATKRPGAVLQHRPRRRG